MKTVETYTPSSILNKVEEMRGWACPVCFPSGGTTPTRVIKGWEILVNRKTLQILLRVCCVCPAHGGDYVVTDTL